MKSENKQEKCSLCGSEYARYILINPSEMLKPLFFYCSEICLLKDILRIPNETKISLNDLKKEVRKIIWK